MCPNAHSRRKSSRGLLLLLLLLMVVVVMVLLPRELRLPLSEATAAVADIPPATPTITADVAAIRRVAVMVAHAYSAHTIDDAFIGLLGTRSESTATTGSTATVDARIAGAARRKAVPAAVSTAASAAASLVLGLLVV